MRSRRKFDHAALKSEVLRVTGARIQRMHAAEIGRAIGLTGQTIYSLLDAMVSERTLVRHQETDGRMTYFPMPPKGDVVQNAHRVMKQATGED